MADMEIREKILEAADKIIKNIGGQKATTRVIANEAGVNIAAINYHFGSKKELAKEMLMRVVCPIENERVRILEELKSKAPIQEISIQDIVRCFLLPLKQFFNKNLNHHSIFRGIIELYDDEMGFRNLFFNLMQDSLNAYYNVLTEKLTAIDINKIKLRLALLWAITPVLIDHFTESLNKEIYEINITKEEAFEEIVRFLAAGMAVNSDLSTT